MIGDNLCPSVHCYTSLFAFFYKENKFDEFMELLKEMLNRGVFPDNFLSFILVKSRKFKELKLSLIMLCEIAKQEMAIKPSFYCYTTLIIGLVKKGMINEGCFYLSKMLSVGFVPNARFYTLLINHFLRRGEVDFALRLVDLMDSNQIKPDLAFYIVTAGGICRNISRINKTWCEANKISKDQKKRLLHVLHQRPMLSSENIFRADTPEIIRYYAMRVLQELEGIIKLQELEGIMPNLYLYNIIIYGYSWANKMENAYNHFKLMQKKGMRPNEVTFTILMDAHGRAGEIDDAVGLFNKMNECGCSPDKIAYMTLLKGICRAGRGLDALSLLYAMRKRGFFPGKVSYENLLHCLCACSLSTPSFRIFEEMIARDYVPRQYFTSRLLFILCEEKKLYEAHKVRDMLHERGLSPSDLTLRLLEETSYKQRASAHIT